MLIFVILVFPCIQPWRIFMYPTTQVLVRLMYCLQSSPITKILMHHGPLNHLILYSSFKNFLKCLGFIIWCRSSFNNGNWNLQVNFHTCFHDFVCHMTNVQIIKGSITLSYPFCPWFALWIFAKRLSWTLFFCWWNFATWWKIS